MSELGQHLKETREQKKISLDDLQQTTKIQKRYLIAIEEGRFDTLPGIFYARAFVKTYAEAIGLDPEPLFDQYRDELPNPQREAVNLPSRTARTKPTPSPKKRTKKGSFVPAVVAVLFIVLVVVGIWVMAQGSETKDDGAIAPDDSENLDAEFSPGVGNEPEEDLEVDLEADEKEVEIDKTNETNETEPIEEESEPSFTLSFVRSEGKTSYFQLENARLSDVRIELSGSSYIDVKNALGRTFYSGQPSKADEIPPLDLEAEERVIFNFGASQHVDLFINEESVDFPLDKSHQKLDITILDEASE